VTESLLILRQALSVLKLICRRFFLGLDISGFNYVEMQIFKISCFGEIVNFSER